MVVANDAVTKRAYMLVHQVSRIGSAGLVLTCHDATRFPKLAGIDSEGRALSETEGNRYAAGTFDRILADVPCSGDGTLRKNHDLWRTFGLQHAHTLHPTQVQIAMRGAALLAVGGRMVYSTVR